MLMNILETETRTLKNKSGIICILEKLIQDTLHITCTGINKIRILQDDMLINRDKEIKLLD